MCGADLFSSKRRLNYAAEALGRGTSKPPGATKHKNDNAVDIQLTHVKANQLRHNRQVVLCKNQPQAATSEEQPNIYETHTQ